MFLAWSDIKAAFFLAVPDGRLVCQLTCRVLQAMSKEQTSAHAQQKHQEASEMQGSTAGQKRQAAVDSNLSGLQARHLAKSQQATAGEQARRTASLESVGAGLGPQGQAAVQVNGSAAALKLVHVRPECCHTAGKTRQAVFMGPCAEQCR